MIRPALSLHQPTGAPSFSTIGKDSVHWSFSKARRFRNKTMTECPELLDLPSTLEKRTTTFGFGRRWQPQNPCGKDAPSPDKYNLRSCFETEKRVSAVVPVNVRESLFQPRSNTPGPGTYDIGTTICKDGPKFTFRPKFSAKVRYCSPPPGTYNPKYKLLERGNYSEITFGVGARAKEEKGRPRTPGPGTYDLPSSFVKSMTTSAVKFYGQVKNKVLKK